MWIFLGRDAAFYLRIVFWQRPTPWCEKHNTIWMLLCCVSRPPPIPRYGKQHKMNTPFSKGFWKGSCVCVRVPPLILYMFTSIYPTLGYLWTSLWTWCIYDQALLPECLESWQCTLLASQGVPPTYPFQHTPEALGVSGRVSTGVPGSACLSLKHNS